MLIAKIYKETASVPSTANAGDTVNCWFWMYNAGNEEGWFLSCLQYNSNYLYGEWQWLTPNGWALCEFNFTMPNENTNVVLWAGHWDGATTIWDDYLQKSISCPTAGAPKASLWSHSIIPSIIPTGTVVDILVTVENIGGATGTMQAWVTSDNVNFEGIPPAFWKDIAPGGREQFQLRFTMPSYTVQFKLVAQRWDWGISQWINDDTSELFTITVTAIAPQAKSLEVAYVKV